MKQVQRKEKVSPGLAVIQVELSKLTIRCRTKCRDFQRLTCEGRLRKRRKSMRRKRTVCFERLRVSNLSEERVASEQKWTHHSKQHERCIEVVIALSAALFPSGIFTRSLPLNSSISAIILSVPGLILIPHLFQLLRSTLKSSSTLLR